MTAKMILVLLMTLSLGMSIADHGKERTPQNGWVSFISYCLMMLLLYLGGFFDNF